MRSYQAKIGPVTQALEQSGTSYVPEQNLFRVRTFRPGLDEEPMMDTYLTGGAGWSVMWFKNKWELESYVAKAERNQFQADTTMGAVTAGTAIGAWAAVKMGVTESAAILESGPAAPLIAITGIAIGADIYHKVEGIKGCKNQVEYYYNALGVSDPSKQSSGLILSNVGGSVVGCHPAYRKAPINNVGVEYGW
jgi:hypothetical protein